MLKTACQHVHLRAFDAHVSFNLLFTLVTVHVLWVALGSLRKYPYSPHLRDCNFMGVGGSEVQKFKEMYEAYI